MGLRAVHLLAAVVWAGSMIFFSLVVMPALRQGLPPSQRQGLIRIIGRRYRIVGWASVGVLLITGSLMAWHRSASGGVVWDSGFGRVLSLKLVLVGVMLALTAFHDFVLVRRAVQAKGPSQMESRRVILWLARANLLVVLGIILCGVWLTEV